MPVCVSDTPGNRQWVTFDTRLTFPVGDLSALENALRDVADGVAPGGRPAADLVMHAGRIVGELADWVVTRKKFSGIAKMAIERCRAI